VTGERAAVFVAALEQSEQLMRAAESVGPAARPLPLFYALSQAGRAVAAAKLVGDWRLAGHGLAAPPQDGVQDLRRRIVKGDGRAPSAGRSRSFDGVASAVGSDSLAAAVELGAVWAAMPDLLDPLPQMPAPPPGVMWRRPLRVYPQYPKPDQPLGAKLVVVVGGLAESLDADGIAAELGHYALGAPFDVLTLETANLIGNARPFSPFEPGVVVTPCGMFIIASGGPKAPLCGFSPNGEKLPAIVFPNMLLMPGNPSPIIVDQAVPPYRDKSDRLIRPRIGAKDDLVSPLMLWWLLLFGLSTIARYDPELWVGALDVNSSEQAVPIEAALDEALEALPELILEALTA
jgi:hypothetical protein